MRAKLLARARRAGPARPRRQGAGGLERADDCRARQCRPGVRSSPTGSQWPRAPSCSSTPRWPMATASAIPGASGKLLLPGLASDHAAMIRAALAPARGHRRPRVSRTRAGLAGHARPPLRQSGNRRLLPHRRRRRGPGGAAERHHRRRHAEPQRARRAKPDPARGVHRPACLARQGRPPVRRHRGHARATICSRTWHRSMPSTCACAPPRSSWQERTHAQTTLLTAARKLPTSIASCCAPRRRCRRRIRPRRRSRPQRRAQPSSASARPARCR